MNQYYLRARYYNQQVGRFTQMDTWMGNNHDPITLHKYAYGNADPVTYTDPTGNFGLASFGVASNIRMTLSNIQIDIGFSLLDAALDPESAGNGPNYKALGLAAIGGPAAFKLLGMLSKKFRQACNSFDGETLVSTEFGLVAIKDIKIGDKVWAYNEETGEKSLQKVVHLIQKEGEKELVDIALATGEVITATAGHPFFVQQTREWVNASELTTDQRLQDFAGNALGVTGFTAYREQRRVYNLTVDNQHTYYVASSEILAHNANRCIPLLKIRSGHIIYGENVKGKAGGFHSILALQIPGRKFISRGPTNIHGVYKAKIAVKNPVSGKWKVKDSDMFPDAWSESQIMAEINGAYLNALSKSFSGTGKWKGRSPSGVTIEGYIDETGLVTTAYPLF